MELSDYFHRDISINRDKNINVKLSISNLKQLGEVLVRERPETLNVIMEKVKCRHLLIAIHTITVIKFIPHKIKEKIKLLLMFKIQEVKMCYFIHYGCPFTVVSGYLQDLGHINFHNDTIFL